jgi:hypothetical protein
MEQNLNNKKKLKDKLILFFLNNKLKTYIFISLLTIAIAFVFILEINKKNNNNIMAEKFIEAELYLTSDKKKSIKIYKEIILSKNKFYSVLALNTILDKNLITDENEILNFFKVLEDKNKSNEQKDLLNFKKGLYLIKISKVQEGNKLLKNLVMQNSRLKPLAEEIIAK